MNQLASADRRRTGIFFRYDNTPGAVLFNIFNYGFLLLLGFITLYPFLYVLSLSISNLTAVADGEVYFWPVGKLELTSYKLVFESGVIMKAYFNTIYYSLSGVLFALFMLILISYPLSISSLYGRRLITILFAITMFFSGGLIPTYLVVRGVGMLNTVFALIVPNCIGVFYMVILRTNFQRLPDSLRESAFMDGANHLRILVSIILPLSKAILAALSLFFIVGYWNSFFAPLIYLRDTDKQPLQVILREILERSTFSRFQDSDWNREFYRAGMQQALKGAAIIISTGPIIFVYPFIQKYFVGGVLIGSIKG